MIWKGGGRLVHSLLSVHALWPPPQICSVCRQEQELLFRNPRRVTVDFGLTFLTFHDFKWYIGQRFQGYTSGSLEKE